MIVYADGVRPNVSHFCHHKIIKCVNSKWPKRNEFNFGQSIERLINTFPVAVRMKNVRFRAEKKIFAWTLNTYKRQTCHNSFFLVFFSLFDLSMPSIVDFFILIFLGRLSQDCFFFVFLVSSIFVCIILPWDRIWFQLWEKNKQIDKENDLETEKNIDEISQLFLSYDKINKYSIGRFIYDFRHQTIQINRREEGKKRKSELFEPQQCVLIVWMRFWSTFV